MMNGKEIPLKKRVISISSIENKYKARFQMFGAISTSEKLSVSFWR